MAKRSKIAAQHRREEVVARHAARRAELKEAQRTAASPEEAPRRVGAASSRCRARQGDHTTTKDISSASALLAGSGPTWFRGSAVDGLGTSTTGSGRTWSRGSFVAPQPAGGHRLAP